MNRKNIDNFRFIDLDEFVSMEIVPIQYVTPEMIVKNGFRVDGITKTGLKFEGLYVDKVSDGDKLCYKFIADNWVNAKSR